ncbi:MAG: cupin domain-containing protein [Oscillospiraceae bacterium]|nr:cupin domain-containing protein [Oscillospiraceae bacterium]
MVRRENERTRDRKKMFDGAGEARMLRILESPDEMYGKGRIFNHLYLDEGCEVGWHVHHGDGETYYILKGEGEYSDNGTVTTLHPGDVAFVDDGEGHSLKNTGKGTLEAIALILYK